MNAMTNNEILVAGGINTLTETEQAELLAEVDLVLDNDETVATDEELVAYIARVVDHKVAWRGRE